MRTITQNKYKGRLKEIYLVIHEDAAGNQGVLAEAAINIDGEDKNCPELSPYEKGLPSLKRYVSKMQSLFDAEGIKQTIKIKKFISSVQDDFLQAVETLCLPKDDTNIPVNLSKNTSLKDFCWESQASARVYNVIRTLEREYSIRTVGELYKMTGAELLAIPGCKLQTLHEFIESFRRLGVNDIGVRWKKDLDQGKVEKE
jgi:hypothetical protein